MSTLEQPLPAATRQLLYELDALAMWHTSESDDDDGRLLLRMADVASFRREARALGYAHASLSPIVLAYALGHVTPPLYGLEAYVDADRSVLGTHIESTAPRLVDAFRAVSAQQICRIGQRSRQHRLDVLTYALIAVEDAIDLLQRIDVSGHISSLAMSVLAEAVAGSSGSAPFPTLSIHDRLAVHISFTGFSGSWDVWGRALSTLVSRTWNFSGTVDTLDVDGYQAEPRLTFPREAALALSTPDVSHLVIGGFVMAYATAMVLLEKRIAQSRVSVTLAHAYDEDARENEPLFTPERVDEVRARLRGITPRAHDVTLEDNHLRVTWVDDDSDDDEAGSDADTTGQPVQKKTRAQHRAGT